MSVMEPMNAPNLILAGDDGDLGTRSSLGDFEQLSDAIRPMHESTSGWHDPAVGSRIHFSPFTAPEDVRFELRKASDRAKDVQIAVKDASDTASNEANGILHSVKDAVSGTATSISSAIHNASEWARERLNGAPHTHTLPTKEGVAASSLTASDRKIAESSRDPRPLSARLPPAGPAPRPVIATTDHAHGHVDMYDAAGHRASNEISGNEGLSLGRSLQLAPSSQSGKELRKLEKEADKKLSETANAAERERARLAAAAHEFRHSKLLVGSEAHVELPRVALSDQIVDPVTDRASHLTAPALGADIDASDGLAEAGAVFGRTLLSGLLGVKQDRSATMLATSRGIPNASTA